jgi:hypothetical protein
LAASLNSIATYRAATSTWNSGGARGRRWEGREGRGW